MTFPALAPLPSHLADFVNPPGTFRPWPLFVLNDEYEPGVGEARLTACLEALARVGYGGVFLHPRPGLITEYLSPRWFEVIRHCITECIRLGLVPALYDEHTYPSGFAGGHVAALAPETTVRFLMPKFGCLPSPPPADALAIYRTENGKPIERIQNIATLAPDDSWCAFVVEHMQPMSWHGEFAYSSLLDPKTTQTFLETTHRRYREELGETNWKNCAAIFTDEPQLPAEMHGPAGRGLHFNRQIQAEFRRRRGYSVDTVIADLYFDSVTSAATRFDFYETLHELWFENFARPLQGWCSENKVTLTGHYLEHDWPCPYVTPGHVHLLAYMDWPGTDLLECFLLEGRTHDHGTLQKQNLDPAPVGIEPHALYFLKQVQSVANQFAKKRVMNECWGAGGHDSTPLDWLRIGRFLAVHGVNLFVPHYATSTIRGARKKDHPQFFSEQSPWFDALGPVNDELGRLSWLVARGKTRQRILVIDPLTTGYCLAAKSDCLSPPPSGPALPADSQRSLRPLRQTVGGFAQKLSDAQADFDVGDEYVLAESAIVNANDAVLQVGEQSYELIVLPPGLQNLRSATFQILCDFARAGGKILGLRMSSSTPAWLDGRPGNWPEELPVQWEDSPEKLLAAIISVIPPRLQFSSTKTCPFPTGVAHQRRETEEGTYYLVVNSSPVNWTGAVRVDETGNLVLLDPASGEISAFDGTLKVNANAAVILFVAKDKNFRPTPATPTPSPPPPERQPCPASASNRARATLEFLGASRLTPNVLVLDTCALETGGENFGDKLVYETNRVYWEKHGMETNGWSGVIQYRDQLLRANHRMRPDSGGTVRYTVRIEPDVDTAGIDLCFECPDQWRATVNGRLADMAAASTWRDPRIARTRIGHLLHEGVNIIELTASPFDVRQEIDQIYLLGNFAVHPSPSGPGFILARETGAGLGSWKAQAMPFYDGKISYQFRRPAGPGLLHLQKTGWHGSVIEANIGERRILTYGPELDIEFADTAPETFSITITGLPFNLFGPFHKPGFPPKRGWASFWHKADVPYDPQPGAFYHLLDLGLFRLPSWRS